MKIFLGLLSLLITVSGNEDVTVEGALDQSILLPCNCSNRNSVKDVTWQMDKPNLTMVAKYNKNISKFYGRYDGRAKMFQAKNNYNCSVLLTNIKKEDQGTYRCSFSIHEIYKYFIVHLSVTGSSSITKIAKDQSEHLRYFITIPFVLMVGICLVLCYCHFSKRHVKMEGAVTHAKLMQLNARDENKNMNDI